MQADREGDQTMQAESAPASAELASVTDAATAGGLSLSRRRALALAASGLALVSGADLFPRPAAAFATRTQESGSATGSVKDQISAAVNDVMRHTGTPGVAVGIVLKGAGYFYFFGEARSDTHAPITPGTIFGLGSVTKTVTSTMLAYQTLAQPTRFTLGDTVTRHLPAMVGRQGSDINKVTLSELASHTASFPHSSGIAGAELFMDQAPPQDLITFWEQFKAPSDPPGSQYVYSDLGFITLGYAVTGTGYNTVLTSTITKPLGLTHFGSAAMMPQGAAYAQGHLERKGKTVTTPGLNTDLMASPTDFMTYLKAHIGLLRVPATLSKAMALTHQKVFSTPASTAIDLGLSWQLLKAAPYTIDKDGASSKGGCQSYIGFIPGSHNGVIILMNKFFLSEYPGYGVTALGRKILGIVASA